MKVAENQVADGFCEGMPQVASCGYQSVDHAFVSVVCHLCNAKRRHDKGCRVRYFNQNCLAKAKIGAAEDIKDRNG